MPATATRKKKPPRAGPGRPRADANGPSLGRDRILHAALALIGEKGLANFGIRDLAAALGVFPAAIYWHVPNREALVAGAIGIALEGVADDLPAGDWQLRLGALLRKFRAALRRHPTLAPAVASQLAYNAAFDAPLLEHVVAALEDARFEGDALVDAFNVVIAAMCGFATLELSTAPDGADASWEADCRARIDAIDPLHHPRLGEHAATLRNRTFLLRWSSGQERPLDSSFDAWVDVVLRGLESRSRALRRMTPRAR
ncbi:TetR/AcrR family transcriptional regulator [Variovorax sp. PBL-E5]|uniref:TetR/AcrR family transcriptional regulator n=1 Tax=Variovorax sp. PBL-E5 TaxID=434014 RepID=UPI0013187FFD|nr:TetR/AcrR family transcriptional regulator [Variovorax sp. PBL-E5]VTU18232.1 Tetracycline repressor protein class H [Variovorax sp. PBL-E5]